MSKKNKMRSNTDSDIIIISGIVKKILNKQAEIQTEQATVTCVLPKTVMADKDAVAVGDQVEVSVTGSDQYWLEHIRPRSNGFYRGNRRDFGEEILVAANADTVLAVVTADYLLHQAGYPEQAMIAAKRAGMSFILYISKWDMVNEKVQELLAAKMAYYRQFTEYVFTGTPESMDDRLVAAVAGRTTLVIGDRGSGKTVLIRSLADRLEGRSFSYRKESSTHTCVLESAGEGTAFIDTPGFRDFALPKITAEEMVMVYPGISGYAKHCQFRNCTHSHEDGCGVIRAVLDGNISREHIAAYQKMSGTIKTVQPKIDYRHNACTEEFVCQVCGTLVVAEGAGTRHRNHCSRCLSSIHVDEEPGDRASICRGIMDPVSVWVRKDGEWALIHKCRTCGQFSSNRIAADDNPMLLMSIAVKPLSMPPFPLNHLEYNVKS